MADHSVKTLEVLEWRDVKEDVAALNPGLAEVLNQLEGVDDFEVIRAKYPYGADISKNGDFNLYVHGKLLSWRDTYIPPKIQEMLTYNWQILPLGIILENSIESYLDDGKTIIPNGLVPAGNIFSALTVFEDIHNNHMIAKSYSISAGCRSLICLTKLADMQMGDRLARKLRMPKAIFPRTYGEQFAFFKAMAESPLFSQPWQTTVIYFSEKFCSAIRHTVETRAAFLSRVWLLSSFWRNQTSYDYIWSHYSNQNLPLRIRNKHQIIETCKHLLKVLIGEAPAYIPCESDIAAPITGLTQALVDYYRPRYNFPIFMRLAHYEGKQSAYYSLHRHTFVQSIPETSESQKTFTELTNISEILSGFIDSALNNKLVFSLENTRLLHMLNYANFTYYHPSAEGIKFLNTDIQSLFEQDSRFSSYQKNYTSTSLGMPLNSLFMHGCIKIDLINKDSKFKDRNPKFNHISNHTPQRRY